MSIIKRTRDRLAKKGMLRPKTCAVRGCKNANVELNEILPFDPIDHESTLLPLCDQHQTWAEERNEFAEQITNELREARKEIGQNHLHEVQRLATPQNGRLREDVLMGDVSGGIELSDAHTKPGDDA